MRDAEELADVLADSAIGGFTVKRLFNQPLSRIRREIASFLSGRRPDETVLLYLSCHILQDARGRALFAAADTEAQFPAATAIEVSTLTGELNECAARRQILIIDYGDVPITEDVPGSDLGPLLASNGRGREVLTVSRNLWYSLGDTPGITQPTVTTVMVEGLRTGAADADRDGHITVAEAFRYAYEHVRSPGNQEPPQLRVLGGEGSSTVLARSPAGRAVTPGGLPEPVAAALQSISPDVRVGAVNEIAKWLTDPDPARALAAKRALQRVADNDTGRVAELADAFLERTQPAAEAVPAQPPTVRLARRDASRSPLISTILEQDRDQALCVAFSPNGRLLASGGRRRPVRVHEVATGDEAFEFGTGENLVNDVAFSPDGRLLATAGDGGAVQLWEAAAPLPFGHPYMRESIDVRTIAFSPDGTLLAGGYGDGAVHIWFAATGQHQRQLAPFDHPVAEMAFSPEGSLLAATSEDGMARVWRVSDGELTLSTARHGKWAVATALSPDGTLLAIGEADGRLDFYDLAAGEFMRSGSAGGIRADCMAFSRDGALLAAGRNDGAVETWQVAAAERRGLHQGHTGPVYCVAFSPTEPLLIASAGNDGTVRIWQ